MTKFKGRFQCCENLYKKEYELSIFRLNYVSRPTKSKDWKK